MVMYNRRHVTEILNEFHQRIEERMKDYLDSVAYAMVMKFKGERVSEYCKQIAEIVKESIPSELDLDYVYCRRYTKGDAMNPDGIRIAIRGESDEVMSFEMAKTFRPFQDEQEIFYHIVEAYDKIIKNEYAMYNLSKVNEKIKDLSEQAGIRYSITFKTCLCEHNMIEEISDKTVVINCDIDKSIDIADTVLFTKAANVMDLSDRSKTNFLIHRNLIEELREIKTTPAFIASKFPIYAFLTKLVNKRDAHKEIAKVYPRDIESYKDNEDGIGFEQTENTFGYVKKEGTTFNWWLTPYHKTLMMSMLD